MQTYIHNYQGIVINSAFSGQLHNYPWLSQIFYNLLGYDYVKLLDCETSSHRVLISRAKNEEIKICPQLKLWACLANTN